MLGRRVRQHFEREHLQRVADQDRGGLVEGAVAGRPAAPQIVVVHGGQVVVHQGVDVDELDRGRGAHRADSSGAPSASPVA